jgi:hypothetical protein
MNNLKKYVAPSCEQMQIDLNGLICTSIGSGNADPSHPVMSKGIDQWEFEEEYE